MASGDLRPHSESLSGSGCAGDFDQWGASVYGCGVEGQVIDFGISRDGSWRGALDRNETRSIHCKTITKSPELKQTSFVFTIHTCSKVWILI